MLASWLCHLHNQLVRERTVSLKEEVVRRNLTDQSQLLPSPATISRYLNIYSMQIDLATK